jgi:hypothetical protein
MSKNALRKLEKAKARKILAEIKLNLATVLEKAQEKGWERLSPGQFGEIMAEIVFSQLNPEQRKLVKRFNEEAYLWAKRNLEKNLKILDKLILKKPEIGVIFLFEFIFISQKEISKAFRRKVQNWP